MRTKFTLFFVLLFVFMLGTQAQQAPGQRRTPEERTKLVGDRLTDSLKISAAQRVDVEAVYLEYYKGQDKLREGLAPGTRPEKADMDKLNNLRDAKLQIILKEEQYRKLKEMEAAMRQRNSQRPS